MENAAPPPSNIGVYQKKIVLRPRCELILLAWRQSMVMLDASSQCTLKVRQTMDTTTVRFAFNTKRLLVHEICPRQQARIQFVENGTKTNTTAKQAYFLHHIEWYYVFTFT